MPSDSSRLPLIDWIERRSSRQRRLAVALVAVAVLWTFARRAAGVILERWWLQTVTDAPVWSTRLSAQAWLFGLSALASGAVLGLAVWLALRIPSVAGRPAWIDRYHQRVGPAHRWGAITLVIVLVWRIATTATGLWQEWLLFWNSTDLGTDVPAVGHDLGYYLFRLPLLIAFSGWLRQLLIAALVIAFVGHLLTGAWQVPGGTRRSAPAVAAHLGLWATLLAAAQAAHLVFVARPGLALDRTGSFDGAGFVQVRILRPAHLVVAVLTLVLGALVIDAVRRGGWRRVAVGAGAWIVIAGIGLVALPAAVQSLVVQPAEAARELPYLEHNLDATRRAYRLDTIQERTVTWTDGIEGSPTDEQIFDVARVPLFDRDQLVNSFQVLQGTQATRVSDIDLDRYVIDEERRPLLVATRNISRADLPESGWVQSHLVYTHGNGVIGALADQPAADGRPDLGTVPVGARQEIYFGEGLDDWYAIVGTKRTEQNGVRFDADTGVPLSSFWRRLVVGLSVGETEPVLSAELTEESQLLMKRSLRERIGSIAPFLRLDGDPYPAVVGNHIIWIVDAYTTSATFPYSQFAPTDGLGRSSDLSGTSFNYLHGSVKVTIDAYSGEVLLYRTDVGGEDDPVLDLWDRVLPGLVRPMSDMPDAIRAHLRYPADLFTVQANLLGRYHVSSASELFDGTRRWSLSPATSANVGDQPAGISSEVMLLAPEDSAGVGGWVSVRTFNPGASSNPTSARDGLAAVAIAHHDDVERVTLLEVDSSTSRQITSPQVAQSAIDADPELAREFTFLNSNGSRVTFGPMTLVPLGDRVVWLRAVIVTGTSPRSTPHLYKVLVVSDGRVGQGTTAAEALIDATL